MKFDELKPGDLLPHSDFMLLIDKVIYTDYEKSITTAKTVKKNDIYFKGHFSGYPILPGVFIIEMMFQSSVILNRLIQERKVNINNTSEKKIGKAVKIKSATFKKEVFPNSTIIIKSEKKFDLMNFSEYKAVAYVDDEEICQAEIILSIQQ